MSQTDKFFRVSKMLLQSNSQLQPSEHSVDDLGIFQRESKEADFHFIHLHLSVGYYSLVVPFRPVFDSQLGCYKMVSSRIQKVLNTFKV